MDSLLISFAILKTNFDEQGKDYIDNFLPFVAECLRQCRVSEVSIPWLQSRLRDTFGLDLPQGALQMLLKRARKSNLVMWENGIYRRNEHALSAYDLTAMRRDAERQHGALIEKFQSFTSQRHSLELPVDVAEKTLLDYISAHAVPILGSVVRGDPVTIAYEKQGRTEFLVSGFIVHLYEEDPAGFSYLETVVKGQMLAAALFFPAGKASQRFHDVTFYLDTPFLLRALGFEGSTASEACLELLHLARELGARLACFHHTLTELEGVLEGCANALQPPHRTRDSLGGVEEYCLRERLSASDLRLMIAKVRPRLQGIGVHIDETPPYEKRLSVDEREFEKVLADEISYSRHGALVHDLNCVTAVYRLRKGRRCNELERCSAIFVTPNAGVVRAARKFFQRESLSRGIPHAMLDHDLTALVWLKRPFEAPDLPKKRLIADCYAALTPNETLWRRYLTEIERLRAANDLTEDDYYTLRFSLQARRALVDETLGEPEAFSTGTIHEVLERARKHATADLENRLRKKEAERAAETRRREHEAEARARDRATYEAARMEQRRRMRAETTKFAERIIAVLVSSIAALFGVAALVGAFEWRGTSGVVATIVSFLAALTGFLGALNLSYGKSVRDWLTDRLQPVIERRRMRMYQTVFGEESAQSDSAAQVSEDPLDHAEKERSEPRP